MTRYTPEMVWEMQDLDFAMDDDRLRRPSSRALSRMPTDAVDRVLDECLLCAEEARRKASYLPEELLAGKALIVFSEIFLNDAEDEEIERVILHEMAHHILGHKTPILHPDLDYDAQEHEADALVEEWLRDASSDET